MITKVQKSLVAFLLLLLITLTSASVFNNVTCNSNKTFTPNSTFNTNLISLLSSLSSNATGDLRFFNTTAGKQDSDTVYGLFMCRGDVPINLCRECVGFATQTIASSCSSSKEAVIWYNECLLRYSYRFIFSNTETIPRYQIQIPLGDPVLLHSQRFYTALKAILNYLPKEAAIALSGSNKYAVKQENASDSITLYGLAQCTPDLSAAECTRCVKAATAVFPKSCCGGSIGESVLFPSCIVRYETYPFYQHSGTSASITTIKGERNISTHVIAIIVVLVVTLVMLFCLTCCFIWIKARKRRKATLTESLGLEITTSESMQFDLATIEMATNKFSGDHKIGRGGYGEVYKGILHGGQEIAVKRLSKKSGQGAQEFKNEVMLIAKLQHRNLVRLIGFCLDDEEKILVYEYVPNKSLDHFLFDLLKQKQLTWLERYNIIKGIARGILYLHEDSCLKIIHRDIKPSNVLLDNNMNPKISDFGMARMVATEQVQGSTNRVVGTYGYMSPEYAMHGQFSEKSDVFSFGVMVLEIISGKRNSCSFESCRVDDLLSYAWNQWKGELPFQLLDPILVESYSANEVERCMQIGLLCVQENPDDRPTMGTVVSYLNNLSLEMPFPLEPAFFMQGRMRRHTTENVSYSGHSTNHSFSSSVNLMSTSNFFPR